MSVKVWDQTNSRWTRLADQGVASGGVMSVVKPTDKVFAGGSGYDVGSAYYAVAAGIRSAFFSMVQVSGGNVSSATVSSGGTLIVNHGGSAAYCDILSGGRMIADSLYPPAAFCYVQPGGSFTTSALYYNGATVSCPSIAYQPDRLVIDGGVTAYNCFVSSAATLTVSSGGVVKNSFVCSGGSVYAVDSGATGSCYVGAGGSVLIGPAGESYRDRIISGGEMTVLSGGFAGYTRGDHGIIHIKAGAYLDNAELYGFCKTYISSGAIIQRVRRFTSTLHMLPGSILRSSIITSSDSVSVGSGVSASDCLVDSGGTLVINGVASGISTYGTITLSNNGSADNVNVWSNGSISISGVANAIIVSGGTATVHADGVVSSCVITGAGAITGSGRVANMTLSGGYASFCGPVGSCCYQTALHVTNYSGGELLVNSSYAYPQIMGGACTNLIISKIKVRCAGAHVLSGTAGQGGILSLERSNADRISILSGGTMTLSAGSCTDVNVASGGRMIASSGALGTYSRASGAWVEILSGASMTEYITA